MKPGKFVIPILILSISLFVVIPHFIGGYTMASEKEMVIQITAKKFEYSPKDIKVKKDVPVVLEFTSLDRLHGFNCPGLGNTLRYCPRKDNPIALHSKQGRHLSFPLRQLLRNSGMKE